MSIITIILFFVYCIGLGSLVTFKLKQPENFFERNIMRIGIGLAVIPLLGLLLNLLHIPITWWIFLVLSIIGIALLFFKFKKPKIRFTIPFAIVCLFFLLACYMYIGGAFTHASWLGDGDSWHHALNIKYISLEKTVNIEPGKEDIFRYIDGYPPGYGILMGVLAQTSGQMIWTLKFFNSLLICLGIFFFYFFAKRFTKDYRKALFATFVFLVVPCYLTRFIWAHSFVVTMAFPLFYCLIMAEQNKKWYIPAGIVLGAIFVIQPTQAVKIFVMFLIWAFIKAIRHKKFLLYTKIFALAFVLGLLWWGPMLVKYKTDILSEGLGQEGKGSQAYRWEHGGYIGTYGSATRMYYFNDFFIAKKQNMINAFVGWGIFATILTIIGAIMFFYKKEWKTDWKLISMGWLVFTVAGLYGGTVFPLALHTFRFWILTAIPLAFIVTEGLWAFKKYFMLILPLAVIGLLITSGYPKYVVNHNEWAPEGAHIQYGQFDAYLWLDTLPKDTKFYYFCHRNKFGDHSILAYDLYTCTWCDETIDFRENIYNKNGFNISASGLNRWLNKNRYEYLMVDGNCVTALSQKLRKKFNISKEDSQEIAIASTNSLLSEVSNSGLFTPVHQTKGSMIWKTK